MNAFTILIVVLLLSGCLGTVVRKISRSGQDASNGLQSFVEHLAFDDPDKLIYDFRKATVITGEKPRAALLEMDQTDDNNYLTGFGGGEKINATYNREFNLLMPDMVDPSGTASAIFVSRIMDAGATVEWKKLSVLPLRPTLKELPDFQQAEQEYPRGNLNMVMLDNVALLHFNTSEVQVSSSGVSENVFVNSAEFKRHARCPVGSHCPTLIPAGVFKSAVNFDAMNQQYLRLGRGASISGKEGFGVGAWIKTTHSAIQTIAGQSPSTGERSWLLNVQPTCGLGVIGCVAFYTVQGGVQLRVQSQKEIADGRWHHVVATREYHPLENGNEEWHGKIYIDGILDAESPVLLTGTDLDSAFAIHIGARVSAAGFTDFFQGAMDEFAIFDEPLSNSSVWDLYTRGGRLRYQVHSCTDSSTCATQPFLGPDGTSNTYFTELENATVLPPVFNLQLSPNRYFQYKVFFDTPEAFHSEFYIHKPSIKRVTALENHYPFGLTSIEHKFSVGFVSLTQISDVSSGSVRYQFGISSSSTARECISPKWYYHDGSQWVIASSLQQANSLAEIKYQISSLGSSLNHRLCLKAILQSNGDQAADVSQVWFNGLR